MTIKKLVEEKIKEISRDLFENGYDEVYFSEIDQFIRKALTEVALASVEEMIKRVGINKSIEECPELKDNHALQDALDEISEVESKSKNINCVQCGLVMLGSYGKGSFCTPFCKHPDCPNYGLLQTGIS